jgi:hypothetical protein
LLIYVVSEPWRRILGLDPDRRVVGGDGFRGLFGASRVPCACAEPWCRGILSVAVHGVIDREQAERTAGLLDFLDVAGVQGHRDRVRFVGGGIPELAVNHDCNWDQGGLSTRGKLEQSDGARARILLSRGFALSRDNLRAFLLRIDKRRQAP